MNRYYIRQKVFSWRDKFSVKDENGEDVFHVEGEIWIVNILFISDYSPCP